MYGKRKEKHPQWVGDKIKYPKMREKNSVEAKEWREANFERDDYTCQKCNIQSGCGKTVYLHAHHIFNFADFPTLRLVVSNGATLCIDCHRLFHHLYGRKKNNVKQFKEFLSRNDIIIKKNPPKNFAKLPYQDIQENT